MQSRSLAPRVAAKRWQQGYVKPHKITENRLKSCCRKADSNGKKRSTDGFLGI